jgi:L-ascorbate metabolism protein UlaG (beta-lactamase superfamily)
MLITHGHFDHIYDAVDLGKVFQPKNRLHFRDFQVAREKKGVQNLSAMNKGGSQQLNDVRVTMVDARHSCGITEEDGSIVFMVEKRPGYVDRVRERVQDLPLR